MWGGLVGRSSGEVIGGIQKRRCGRGRTVFREAVADEVLVLVLVLAHVKDVAFGGGEVEDHDGVMVTTTMTTTPPPISTVLGCVDGAGLLGGGGLVEWLVNWRWGDVIDASSGRPIDFRLCSNPPTK